MLKMVNKLIFLSLNEGCRTLNGTVKCIDI